MVQGILKDKKILFICPKFIGYDKVIKAEMESLGAQVLLLHDRPYNGFYDFFKKINIRFVKTFQSINWYLKLNNIDLSSYNTLFVVRGEHIPDFVYKKIKKSKLKMILYQWDSVKNLNYLHQIDFFDKISTFDRQDSKQYGFNYWPLFYRKEYAALETRNLDSKNALFVGTFQHKRYQSLIELKNRLSELGINTTIKIRTPYYFYLKQKLKGVILDKKFLIFEDISLSEILKLYSESDIIIDAASEHQTGLTMRTFEALGAKKILLTNNQEVRHEGFFDSSCIKFFDENFTHKTFVNQKHSKSIEDCRIDNWIAKLIVDNI